MTSGSATIDAPPHPDRGCPDLGGDQVLVESRNAIRGKGSGLEVDQAICTVVTVREGKIAAIWDFTDRAEALEAAGLRE